MPFAFGRMRDLNMVFCCWLAMLVTVTGQCIVFDIFVIKSPAQVLANLIWFAHSWGVWLLFTPLLYDYYYKHARTGTISLKGFLPAAVVCYALLLILEWFIKTVAEPDLKIVNFLLYFVPRYFIAMLVVTLVWMWRNKTLVANCWQAQKQPASPINTLLESLPETLPKASVLHLAPNTPIEASLELETEFTRAPMDGIVAYKGRDKAFISLADIEGVIAARNYLDIYCKQGEYIVRETMKNMETLLAGQDFVRTHRSALVRLSAVSRFKRLPSGSGLALLSNQREIPVNKNFMSSLSKGDLIQFPMSDSERRASQPVRQSHQLEISGTATHNAS